jgi:DNA-binding NarL/FixJ family response regulator
VILEAENGLHLLELLRTMSPDVILMDIRMPVMNGIEAADYIKKLHPNLKIIAYSQYDQVENIIEMNIHGVKSFIGKEDNIEELFKAIRIVHDGGVYMTTKSAQIIQNYLKRATVETKCPYELTELEIQLLKGICNGLSSTELAELIHKSPRTIEKYRIELYKKFNVTNKEQLIAKVSKWSLEIIG